MVVECKNSDTGFKNTGATEQCLEGLTIKTAVSLPGFSFPDAATAKDKEAWDAAIAAKQIFPLYEVEELASANTEDTLFEGRSRQYVTAQGKKISTYSTFLGMCSHLALKSFNKKPMRLFEFTEDNGILGVSPADGTVKGQSVVLNIGKRLPATADRPPSTLVTINYSDFNELEDNPAKLYPTGWNPASDLFGIFDVTLEQVSASSTVVKFNAGAGCAAGDDLVSSFVAANFEMREADGTLVTTTFTAADANGVYTLTGTGFVSGNTINLVGVVEQAGINYEGIAPLVIVVT